MKDKLYFSKISDPKDCEPDNSIDLAKLKYGHRRQIIALLMRHVTQEGLEQLMQLLDSFGIIPKSNNPH